MSTTVAHAPPNTNNVGEPENPPNDYYNTTGTSVCTVGFILFLALIWVVIWLFNWKFGIAFPFLFLPLVPLGCWRWKKNPTLPKNTLVSVFGAGAVPASMVALALEILLALIWKVIYLGFGVDIDTYLQDSSGCLACYLTFWALFAWTVLTPVEEGLKLSILVYARKAWPTFADKKSSVMLAVAAALGLATTQNIITSLFVVDPSDDHAVGTYIAIGLALSIIETPLFALTGYLIGVMVVRRDVFHHRVSCCRILAVPILSRGFVIFISTVVALLSNTIARYVLGVIINISILVLVGLYTRCQQNKIPSAYLQTAGYIQLLGEGAPDPPSPDENDYERDVELGQQTEQPPEEFEMQERPSTRDSNANADLREYSHEYDNKQSDEESPDSMSGDNQRGI